MLALSNFSRNSLAATSNLEFTSLQLQRLWTVSKIDRGKLRAIFVWLWLWPCRGPRPVCIGNLSRETAITFARSYVPGVETAIAFAGEKRVFVVCFSVAVVTVVSTVAVQGRAVVMVVSCWPASVAAEASLVSTLPCRSIRCAKKFALLGLMVDASVTIFALQAKKYPKSAFYGVLGEFCTGCADEGPVPGELCPGPCI